MCEIERMVRWEKEAASVWLSWENKNEIKNLNLGLFMCGNRTS